MSVVVINDGGRVKDSSGRKHTNGTAQFGDQGTVRVRFQGIEYVFGPGNTRTLENGIGAALVAADSRLRIADSSDGQPNSGRS